ncbi:MAG: outer membrane lipoprotein chaperone LolA [Candidatus Accumulibacter sp.]|jgi:outer membrane lipoprotein carrier protein|nr:outer membrane lipoprotein chaperone LolA [Accumulibacter sp.]
MSHAAIPHPIPRFGRARREQARKDGRCRRFFSGVLYLCALLFVRPAEAGAIDKLYRFLDTTTTLSADFAQIVVAKNGRRPQRSAGTMLIWRPGKFRWQIDEPYSQLLVGDGERVWMYDPDLRQATVSRMDAALGSTPAALLVGTDTLEKNFELRELEAREGLEWVEAQPRSPDGGFEKLHLGFDGEELKAMELYDNFGQTTSLLFSNPRRNQPLPDALFRFAPPAGVDVIGQ